MNIDSVIMVLIIGALAGWLAGKITKGKGFGIAINIVVGMVGAVIGGFLFSLLGVNPDGFIVSLLTATVGSVSLLFVISQVKQ